MLPYNFKYSKRLNEQKKRRNFYVFLCTIHEQKSGVRPPEPFGSGLWDSVLEKSVVLFQQDRQCSFGFFILRRNIHAPVKIEHRFAIPPQGDFRGSAFLVAVNGRLLIVFHPVVKYACSNPNRSFCPHCFFLLLSLFSVPFGMMYITINQRRSQRNFQHILHKDECRKLCMIPTKKASPTLPRVGHLWERENHSEETKLRRTGQHSGCTSRSPFRGFGLGLWVWITVRSGTPIQIRRRFRTPHQKGHRHRFPFP